MSITLIGHGYIGSRIHQALINADLHVVWLSHNDVIRARILPTHSLVINAAGYTGKPNVDACEDHKLECVDGNITWPLKLHELTTAPIIHIGSGCLYTGSHDYTEWHRPNFDGSFYSRCKVFAEDALSQYLETNSYMLRVRIPFGPVSHPKNYLTKLQTYPRLIDCENSLTCLDDLCRVVVYFVQNRPPAGTYNVVNTGSITARQVADLMGLKKEWFASEGEFLKTTRTGRSTCTLSNRKLRDLLPIRHVETALSDCIEQIGRSGSK